MSSFLVARNQYATASLATPMGIYLSTTQAHIDIKRFLSRIGLSISDSSARSAIETMTERFLSSLRTEIASAHELREVNHV